MEPMYLKCKRRCFICKEKRRKVCKRQARKKAPPTMTKHLIFHSFKFFLLFFPLCVVIGNIITSTNKRCIIKGTCYEVVLWLEDGKN